MTSRIDIVAQNGPDGRVYLIEKMARCMAGEFADQKLMGDNAGKKRYELFIPMAINILEIVEDHEKN